MSSTKAPAERNTTVKANASKSWIVVAGLVLVGFAACDTRSPKQEVNPKPEAKVVDTTVAFPNVIGVSGETAKNTIKELFPNGGALTESRDAYEYGVANRCLWRDPAGNMISMDSWPVTSAVRFLDPEMPGGTSPTEPVQPGVKYEKLDRLYFQLHTEKPADVWCQPYGDVGPAGDTPNIAVPNDDDDGEPWICRRHRLC